MLLLYPISIFSILTYIFRSAICFLNISTSFLFLGNAYNIQLLLTLFIVFNFKRNPVIRYWSFFATNSEQIRLQYCLYTFLYSHITKISLK